MITEEIEQLRKERDELAARCERLQEKLEHFLFLEDGMDESTKPEVVVAARAIISESPTASLAHVRAEAIDSVISELEQCGKTTCSVFWLMWKADDIRQNASQTGGVN